MRTVTHFAHGPEWTAWLAGQLGTTQWVVAARLTAKLKSKGYTLAISPARYMDLQRAYKARLLGEARGMARAEKMLDAGVPHHQAVPPSPSDDCNWKCEFAAVCPMFDDGSRAEDMLQVVYHRGDPWQRYDRLGSPTTPGL